MECTKIRFEGSAALLQFAATHLSGMSKKKGIRLAITGLSPSHQRKEMASPADITYLTGAQFPVDSAVNQSGAHFANFKNSQKIEGKAYDDNFFTIVIRTKRTFLRAKNKIWG